MGARPSRRDLLRGVASSAAIVGAAALVEGGGCGSTPQRPKKSLLNVGIVGVGNRGSFNILEMGKENCPANIVALCDVDDQFLADAAQFFPQAGRYNDYHELIARPDIDAVLVATPDHTHAWATLAALRAGKHVYCEKPLAHSLEEIRLVTQTARQLNRVTQLGTQSHDSANYRKVVDWIRSGAIGTVSDVHVFVDKAWFADGPPKHADRPPPLLHYDLWLGPTPPRPYSPDYLPASWRRWWAFGEGTLGDMGCHFMDIPFGALELGSPAAVRAEGPPADPERCPRWLIVHYEFPARGSRPPVTLHWYDSGKRPDKLIQDLKLKHWHSGILFVGSEGWLVCDLERHVLLPEEKFKNHPPPPAATTAPASPGHHHQWVQACLDENPGGASANFDYGGPLSEIVLLGCLAHRLGKPIEWDAAKLAAANTPEAEPLIHLTYRSGVHL
ncbi:MAG TPA: Gfo/Idh/MocA family oxidoreductase [Tepidisphaeraceae bacterium]